jgi:hypothetical protein
VWGDDDELCVFTLLFSAHSVRRPRSSHCFVVRVVCVCERVCGDNNDDDGRPDRPTLQLTTKTRALERSSPSPFSSADSAQLDAADDDRARLQRPSASASFVHLCAPAAREWNDLDQCLEHTNSDGAHARRLICANV